MPSWAAQIFAYLMQILGVDTAIRQEVDKLLGIAEAATDQSREHIPYNTETIGLGIEDQVNNVVYGLSPIRTAIGLLQIDTTSPHPATLTDILAAIGAIPVYTLPDTPPPGYGTYVPGNVNVPQICALD